MQLHVINSGSRGNCYLLEVDDRILVLDCGVSFSEIQQAVSFRMLRIDGCLLTHEHGDHSKCALELLQRGVDVFTSEGTASCLYRKGFQKFDIIKNQVPFKVGDFTVLPFDVPHDAKEPFGYHITHPKMGSLLFITDAMYCKYVFKDIDIMLIEANYCDELVQNDPVFLQSRIKRSHMSIETCLKFIEVNSASLKNVVLLHLSDRNSDEELFKTKVRRHVGCPVYVATKNQTINL